MRRIAIVSSLAIVSLAAALPVGAQQAAQAGASPTREEMRARYLQHRGDFDYLLGDWEFTGTNKQYGRIHGFWSAAKLPDDGQVIDEYRVVGDRGETYDVSTTIRAYNAVRDRWELVSADMGTGLQDFGTGQRAGNEMHIQQTFGTGTPGQSTWRIRYHDIAADRFSWAADRSTDGGRTWTTGFQTLDARRIGPARTLGPLTSARRPTARE